MNVNQDGLDFITVSRCNEHNLKGISLRIPLNQLTLVCGVSGSGKSTLANDVLFCEGQGRFLESFSAYARIFQARLNRSHTAAVSNIPPALALGQRLSLNNPRSTVSTLTDLHSPLRMLFSRFAAPASGEKITRSHLSFNHPLGACPHCQGMGQVYEIDQAALITDENRSLREGALSLSMPNGYIMYSQVTLDVLDQVCQAHGFTVDVPWKDLDSEQKRIVLYGSDRVQIPFGKHPLSSRLRWTGITAKPRELGTYRGIIPIMEEILNRGPNPNILRYCLRQPCPACGGLRLAGRFLDLSFRRTRLRTLLEFTVSQLASWGEQEAKRPDLSRPEQILIAGLTAQARILEGLSLGHLALSRAVPTLSRSEGQRIQIANLLKHPISGMLYVLDEPGSGLHPAEKKHLYRNLRRLVEIGSTVVMVSHDRQALAFADWVVELGPAGGDQGGYLLYCDTTEKFLAAMRDSRSATPTVSAWRHPETPVCPSTPTGRSFLTAGSIRENDLDIGELKLPLRALTAVSGPSGSGKSTVLAVLAKPGATNLLGRHSIQRLITVDQQPLGKNARSNPATYTKLFDDIRNLFAAQPEARELHLSASSFSFNTDQGCCATCQGAGMIEITMHFLQSLFQPCPQCQGRRYQENVLAFRYRGLAIDEVLNLTIDRALDFFAAESKISHRLKILSDLGLGYLTLGQPSSTLSGGEAQRVKLASFMHNGKAAATMYLLDEPCLGLHDQDIPCLLRALKKLSHLGATVIVAENHPRFIAGCDWLVELRSGKGRSTLGYSGEVGGVRHQPDSLVAALLAGAARPESGQSGATRIPAGTEATPFIRMQGVRTHNLQNVSVAFPERRFTVVGGPAGSGKSSLVLETLFKTLQQRYAEHLSPYLRDRLSLAGEGDCDAIEPLKPAVALAARYLEATPRSTVGTLSGIQDTLRVLFSRLAVSETLSLHASHFSFNHHDGACPDCNGLGFVLQADVTSWVSKPERSILDGAFSGEKSCQFFLDRQGRHMAILQSAARKLGVDITPSWQNLSQQALDLILEGSQGNFEVTWKFKRGKRSGEHRFQSPWIGFNRLVLQDYQQKKEHRKKENLYAAVIVKKDCPACQGLRLREFVLKSRVGSITLASLLTSPLARLIGLVENHGASFFTAPPSAKEQLVCLEIMPILFRQFDSLIHLGLGYLTLSRAVNTLSSGEHQRVRLASLLANRLSFTLFILDEVSRGLHPLDIGNLLVVLRDLLHGGNTIIAIDHHPLVTAQADWRIQLGPGSGKRGGQVVAMGREISCPDSNCPLSAARVPQRGDQSIGIAAAEIHNLKRLDLHLPATGLTLLCGVSGSGKSTLLHRVIYESARTGRPVNCQAASGFDRFQQVCSFAPQNAARQGSERLAGFLGMDTAISDAFAKSADNRADRPRLKKLLRTRSAASSCTHCAGQGEWTTDLDYLGSFATACSHCLGSGLSSELCRLPMQGVTLAEFLAGEIDMLPEAAIAACHLEKICSCLREFTLGYLNLGRRMSSLSQSETQRLRLARLFLQLPKAPSLLLLDEPDSGLSPTECRQLIDTLKKYLLQGHAAIVISHHPLLMCQADYLVDLGPGAGEDGGRVTACGTPQELLSGDWPLSKTAAYLKKIV